MKEFYKHINFFKTVIAIVIFPLASASLFGQTNFPLSAAFTQDKNKGCLPLEVNFTNQSQGAVVTYFWDFGNGNTSALKDPGAIYTKPGKYTVKLIAKDISGNADTIIKQFAIHALANPAAGFTVNQSGGCTGDMVQFTDTSKVGSGAITQWQWNFGDGSASALRHPSYTYNSGGNFAISLIITDSNGCKSYINQTNRVKVTQPLAVGFTSNNTGACTLPNAVNFNTTATLQPGVVYTYVWKFGNGDSSTAATPSYTYTKMGMYDVSLSIKDDNNCVASSLVKNYISIGKTVASFDIDNKKSCAPHTVNFKNTSVGVPQDAIVIWYFGNGDSAVGYNAQYNYTQPGTYSVTLAISSPGGCNDILVKKDSITVLAPVDAAFGHSNPVSCVAPHSVNFFPANNNSNAWNWDFGDGTSSPLKRPTKNYTQAGIYTVTLTITDNGGCVGTFVKKNIVRVQSQQATFTPSVNFGCVPMEVSFANASSSAFQITNYQWNFGDGQTSTQQTPKIVYNQAGTYRPSLIITDKNGCKDTMQFDSIMAGIKTNPDFFADRRVGCKIDMRQVQFTNTTDRENQQVDGFYWNVAGITSTEINPLLNLLVYPGTYDATLISVSNGCADTMVKKDYITIHMPHASAEILEDPCKLDTVYFRNKSVGGQLYSWSINGNTQTNDFEYIKFFNPGAYVIKLWVKDTITGCFDTKEYPLEIRKPMVPGFTVQADSICANTPITFSDTTVGAVNSRWSFSTGLTMENPIISPIFSNPGFIDVTLNVTDAYGCKESISKTAITKILGPDYFPTATPDIGCFGYTTQLTKNGHSVHGLSKVIWSDETINIESLDESVPFVINAPVPTMHTSGVPVYLTAYDNLGCRVIRQVSLKVSKPVATIHTSSELHCDFTRMYFSHNNTLSQSVHALQYAWDINGTSKITGDLKSVDLSKSGTNTLSLMVKDSVLGCTDTSSITVQINVKEVNPAFEADNTQATCPPAIVQFADKTTTHHTTITKAFWEFGDGSASDITSPVKTYFFPGNYNVKYKVTDVDGCQDSITVSNKIFVGGPIGTYFIDKYNGCVPFGVNFTSVSQNSKVVRWDLGNGTLKAGANTHTNYTLPGSFYPAMVLEDSMGCMVVYPVKEPIVGYATPVPSFTVEGNCAYDNFKFTNTTDTSKLQVTFNWLFDDGKTATGCHTNKKFTKGGVENVTLTATAANGCQSHNKQQVKINTLKADFDYEKNPVCRFSDVVMVDKSTADAGIAQWQWNLGDGRTDTIQNPVYYYDAPGQFEVSLIIKDKVGCYDTMPAGKKLIVFDTITPPAPLAHRVTVEESNQVRLEFAPYNLADFNGYAIYRSIAGQPYSLYKSIKNAQDTVFIDSDVATHKNNYSYKVYTQTLCDKISVDGESNGHTTVLLNAIADTNAVHVNWTAYKGWEMVKQYQLFRKAPGVIGFTQIATVPATQLQYKDEDVICGYTYQYVVFAEQDAAQGLLSGSNNIEAAPIHKASVLPAQIVRATVENDHHVLVQFAAPAVVKAPIDFYTLQKSTDGVNFAKVFTSVTTNDFFEDFETNVQTQSYFYRVIATDVCGDVSAPGNIGKTIVLKAETDNQDNVNVSWTNYLQWDEGIKAYEVELMGNTGVFEKDKTNAGNDTTYTDASQLYNHLAKVCYRVKAVSNNGTVSYSNSDCAKGRSSLFVPNAFTPNGDEKNNKFTVVGAYIKKYEVTIADRWGEVIFKSTDIEDSWDGTFKGMPAADGVYVYQITSQGMDSKHHNISGTVTLLR